MRVRIEARIAQFEDAWRLEHLEPWHREWVAPLLDRIEMGVVSWESVLDRIGQHDPAYGRQRPAIR